MTSSVVETLSDYAFHLPQERVAAVPAEKRDGSRLFVLGRERNAHRVFSDLPSLLKRGDLLVLNRTRVLKARLVTRKATGGRVELLVLESFGAGLWRVLAKGTKSPGPLPLPCGAEITLLLRNSDGSWTAKFSVEDLPAYLELHGRVPLPPYILKRRRDRADRPEDAERYQTVFADDPGSVAAPTAALHFTPEVLAACRERGVETAFLSLHVGWGTFQPIDDLATHRMLPEQFEIPEATAEAVRRAKARGGRVIAVGTTSTRSLETAAASGWTELSGPSSLFIKPGHRFRALDALLTNFHVPNSTPVLLAAAFAGRERLLAAYREAVAERYRFYSYGDSMFIPELLSR